MTTEKRVRNIFLLVYLAFFTAILIAGTWFYFEQKKTLGEQATKNLSVISDLKAKEIARWREERLTEGSVLMESPGLAGDIAGALAHEPAALKKVLDRFRSRCSHYQYKNIFLLDSEGKTRLSLESQPFGTPKDISAFLAAAFKTGKPILSDLHADSFDPEPHISVVVPIFLGHGEKNQKNYAILMLRHINQFLYPMIQTWPVPSQSGETILVRRDGNMALFLNPLRFDKDAAFKLRFPLSRTEIPAVMAVRGAEGIFSGLDYRGVKVLSALKAVPNSPWFIVSKIDEVEALALWREKSLLILSLILIVLTTSGLVFYFAWRQYFRSLRRSIEQTEDYLRDVEDRLRYAFYYSATGMALLELDGLFFKVNPAFCEITGYSEEELMKKKFMDITHPDDLEKDMENARKMAAGESACYRTEKRYLHKNGYSIWGQLVAFPVIGKDGKPKYFVAEITDISERKMAEKALRVSEDKFRTLAENTKDILYRLDLAGKIIHIGPQVAQYGYSPAEMMYRHFYEYVHPDDQDWLKNWYDGIRAKGDELQARFRFMDKQGRVCWAEEVVSPQYDKNGKIFGYIGVLRDIRERKLAEDALRESEAKYRALADNLVDQIYQIDLEGTIVHVGHQVSRYGYKPEDLIGKNFVEIIHPDDRQRMALEIQNTIANNSVFLSRFRLFDRKGNEVWMEEHGRLLLDAQNKPVGITGVLRDITDRMKAEEELRQSEEKFRVLFEQAVDIIFLMEIAPDGMPVIREANHRALSILGYEPGELIGRPVSFIDADPDATKNVNERRKRVHAGTGMIFNARHRCKDGTIREFECSATELKVGKKVFAVSVERDVTERNRAEEALRESEAQLSNALQMSRAGNWEYDVGSDMFTFNDNFYRIFHTTVEEAGGYKMPSADYARRFCHPDDAAIVGAEVKAAIETSDPNFSREIEHRILYADGGVGFIAVRFFIVKDAQGRTVRTYGVNQDITERKKAQEEINNKSALLEAMANSSTDGILVVDQQNNKIFQNQRVAELWSIPKDIADDSDATRQTQHGMRMAKYPDQLVKVDSFLKDHPGESSFDEIELLNGRILERYSDPVLGKGGTNYGRVWMFHDITNRKKAEVKLRESEIRYRELFNNIRNGVAIYRAVDEGNDFIFTDFNKAGEFMDNDRKEFLIGKSLRSARPGIEEFGLLDVIRKVWKTGNPEYFPAKQYHEGKLTKWYENFVYRLPSGEIVAVFDDVTEQKKAEEELRNQSALLEAQADSTLEGILIVDLKGKKIFQNRRTVEIWKIPREIAEDPDDSRQVQHVMHSTKNPEQFVRQVAYLYEHPDETSRDEIEMVNGTILDRYSAPVLGKDGKNYGRIWTFRDITESRRSEMERRKLEEQLQLSHKLEAIGSLAGGVAHDFNNLLSVILNYTQFVLEGMQEGDPGRDDLLEAKKAAESATVLTRQLLAFGRKQMLQLAPLNLNRVVERVGKLYRRILGEDISLFKNLAPDLGLTMADVGQIEQVIMNIVVNARDAMPNGGKLTIKTSNVEIDEEYKAGHPVAKPGPYVLLEITDTGCGMDGQTRARIFEPFFTTKEKGKGTGLGLSMAYGIIKQCGGYIWAYSEPGLGSTFKIYLPRELAVSTADVIPPSTVLEPSVGGETILVVEDEEALRKLAQRVLDSAGYRVLTAASGPEAIRAYFHYEDEIHLLLTDVVMPKMGGRTLAENLSKTRPSLKVLYMSGYTDDAIVHHGVIDAGMHFIGKPFTSNDLKRKVREVLDGGKTEMSGEPGKTGDSEAVKEEKPLEKEALGRIPKDIQDKLREAVIAARYDEILEIIETLRSAEPDTAAGLRRMARVFDYDGIRNFLNLGKGD